MDNMTRRGALALGAAVLALATWQPAMAQQQGTIYYMIPTLIDEFQTETENTIESVFGGMGYQVVSLDAQNQAGSAVQPDGGRDRAQAGRDHHRRGRLRAILPGVEKAHAAGIQVMVYDRHIRAPSST